MNIKLIIKGFIIGIGKIIPGVSGSMLAMMFGIYEDLIEAVTNFFDDTKKHLKLLINFGIGLFIAIILFSRVLLYLLNTYYYFTMSLFLGLILGTIIKFSHKLTINKKNILIFIICILFILFISISSNSTTYIFKNTILSYLYLSLLGIIDAASSIIPGISGTAIFMMLGSYELVLNILASPFSLAFIIYGLGVVLGVILVCYIMNYLLKNKKSETYMLIFAFSIGSVILVFLNIVGSFTIGLFLILLIGIYLGYIFDK